MEGSEKKGKRGMWRERETGRSGEMEKWIEVGKGGEVEGGGKW